MKMVMIFGAFDGLHPGHIDFIRQAKKYGDYLIISIGTDKNVAKIKGHRPLFSEKERIALLKSLRGIDEVILGAEENFYKHIADFSPDVVCLGYDQWADEEEVKKHLKEVGLHKTKVVRLKPHKADRAKSTIVKKKSVDF